MSSPSTTASSIPTTPTTPLSLPSPLPNLDAAMNPSMKSSHSMPHLALPPPVAVRPRRIALQPSFKLQAPPAPMRSRSTIIEEHEDEDGCDMVQIRVPPISAMSDIKPESRPKPAPLVISNTAPEPAPSAVLSPSSTRPNVSFADAVAGRSSCSIPSSITMTFGENLSGQPRSTKAGVRTHRRAQSISMSVSDSVGLSARRARPSGTSDSQGQVLMVPRRPTSLTPSPRMVHFAPIPETGDGTTPRASVQQRPAHPRVSALAPAHPGLRSSYGLAPPPRFHTREESTPRALANSGRIIALPSFEDDAFAIRGSSSYAFGTNPAATAVGRGFEQWGH